MRWGKGEKSGDRRQKLEMRGDGGMIGSNLYHRGTETRRTHRGAGDDGPRMNADGHGAEVAIAMWLGDWENEKGGIVLSHG